MHRLLNITFFLFLFLFTQFSFCQNFADKDYYLVDSLEIDKVSDQDKKLMDSCLTIYHKAKSDTDKVNVIKVIVEESWDDKVWPKYNNWVYNYTTVALKKKITKKEKRKLLFSLASAINNIGYLNSIRGNVREALEYYHKSLTIQQKLGDKEGTATSLNNIGAIYNKQGNIQGALEYYHKSLKTYQEIKNEFGQAQTLNNIGHIYQSQEEVDLALEYFHKSLKIFEKTDNKRGVATLLNSIGFIYFRKKNLPKAIDYYNQSLTIRKEIGDKKGLASSLNNLAAAHEHLGEIDQAMEYYTKCLDEYGKIDNRNGLSITYNNIGRMYYSIGEMDKARKYSLKGLELSQEMGMPGNIKGSALTLSKIYKEEGKGIKALEMFELYIEMRDSVINEQTKITAAKEQAKYEYEKLKALDDAEYDKLITIKNKEKEKQKIISIAVSVGLLLVVVFLFFVFNRLKITRKQKLVIEHQNKEIVSSINYAKRIQEAILPTKEYVKESLPNSFILYKPKDIVAGDFYWINKNNDTILFAAADCTGHGVPGAMVSVVCHNAMERTIREYKLSKPGEILDKSREIVEKQLNKAESIATFSIKNIRDGMDIALCSLNTKTNELMYAGAYNPLWIIRKNSDVIEEVKALRQSIGRVDQPKAYETHQLNLNSGDTIYIFSDGYADQFGGPKGKKLMYRKFKELLLSIQEKNMEEQNTTINNYFEEWKGDMEQIDDVCVIGVRI